MKRNFTFSLSSMCGFTWGRHCSWSWPFTLHQNGATSALTLKDMRADLSIQFVVVPVVFRHCSSYVFAFLNFSNFDQAEQFRSSTRIAEAATDAAAPFDCKCTSYKSRSPLGMAASTYGRLHELHGFQHLHQLGALFLHELQRFVLVTRAGLEGAFSLRGCHFLTAICWVPLRSYALVCTYRRGTRFR